MPRLSDDALAAALSGLPGWSRDPARDALVRELVFPDFVDAFGFATRVALLAEKADHHPELTVDFKVVRLALRTHDEDAVTARDVELARAIEALRP